MQSTWLKQKSTYVSLCLLLAVLAAIALTHQRVAFYSLWLAVSLWGAYLNWSLHRQLTPKGLAQIVEGTLRMEPGTLHFCRWYTTEERLQEGEAGWVSLKFLNAHVPVLTTSPRGRTDPVLIVKYEGRLHAFRFGDAHTSPDKKYDLLDHGHRGPAKFDLAALEAL